jgi:hypothetical protein
LTNSSVSSSRLSNSSSTSRLAKQPCQVKYVHLFNEAFFCPFLCLSCQTFLILSISSIRKEQEKPVFHYPEL